MKFTADNDIGKSCKHECEEKNIIEGPREIIDMDNPREQELKRMGRGQDKNEGV